ncbi:MAG: peptide chain release factor N(5)-glutamine methyltransferase [Alphaproteobacteria bacterium]|jgi:release factor glutamine methyltransferase|nr:peptide chain release factor N(5)-glutamine methyltransferase [Alphaproteobacteria bacterium]MBT4017348.1 peptide chain release factor N(5)-glutamine methyltransferase [Alphaproteobacteria bacterium]MBT4966856.1 peptide chain release factor N(5)-glutamine methyltransferase [Alphaproteobacteria bacterium]MBT5158800.1 peptide chain release factor N(5)-glutamine methyltransferase [Alphaproteobacteria bacterium]MBT6387378.1 peptide chain release factor N(5)-glutamine methyltransferase [Alphaprot
MPAWGEIVSDAARLLANAAIDQPNRDARTLLAHVVDTTPERVFAWPETDIAPSDVSKFNDLIARRLKCEPLSRILGRREFWSLSFGLSEDTLDPRADSESVIEAVLSHCPDRARDFRILDLGTGTGCLLAALLSEYENASGVAVDLSEGAVQTARQNLSDLGLAHRAEIQTGDWDAGLQGEFDIIVSNPPYIVDGDISGLARGVVDYDPHRALAGGIDGLDAYRQLASLLPARLALQGLAVLEFGHGQAHDVAGILTAKGLEVIDFKEDLAGRKRCVVCRCATNK